jgi:23S rRNA (cytidine1920-2'-O)/16S rRNA (cytidine1409-2'-O)-methyltransferase
MDADEAAKPLKLRADNLLVARGLVPSRARAQSAIKAGQVRAAGRVVTKPSDTLAQDAAIELAGTDPYVSRAAHKLIAALDAFAIDPKDKDVLDIGASTGGFTQVALERQAAHVTAIDVGHGQLHDSLKDDPRLTLIEGVNARDLMPGHLTRKPDLILADVSFISLTLALPPALGLAAANAQLIALVKPQFEAGRAHLGKGGVVRDPDIHRAVCDRIQSFLESKNWRVLGLIASPLPGGDGNQEFLIGASRV